MNASEQNFFIAASIERAEKATETLMHYGIAIASMDIGRYTNPVIKVHYSPGCQRLKGHGFSQNPDSLRGVMLIKAALEECLILWEEPYNPAIDIAASAAMH